MEKFIKDLKNAVEPDQVPEKPADEDHRNDIVAPSVPSEHTDRNSDTLSTDLLLKNITTAIKRSGDYKKVINQMDNTGILTEDEREELNCSESLKDLGANAGKVLLTKSTENPKAVFSVFQKLVWIIGARSRNQYKRILHDSNAEFMKLNNTLDILVD